MGKGVEKMKSRSRIKMIWILSLILMMTVASAATAMAVDTGRLELYMKYTNVRFDVYKVGNYLVENGNRNAILTEEFKDAGIDLNELWADASETRQEATILQNFVKANRPAAHMSGVNVSAYSEAGSPYTGRAVIDGLGDGVYLFVKSGGDARLEVTPFIAAMPYLDQEKQTWSYSVKAYPKSSYTPSGGGGDDGDDGGGGDRPPGSSGTQVEIPEGDVPLASWTIPEEPVPLAGIPKMGDMGVTAYLLCALAASAAGMIALWRGRKCRKDEENWKKA